MSLTFDTALIVFDLLLIKESSKDLILFKRQSIADALALASTCKSNLQFWNNYKLYLAKRYIINLLHDSRNVPFSPLTEEGQHYLKMTIQDTDELFKVIAEEVYPSDNIFINQVDHPLIKIFSLYGNKRVTFDIAIYGDHFIFRHSYGNWFDKSDYPTLISQIINKIAQ